MHTLFNIDSHTGVQISIPRTTIIALLLISQLCINLQMPTVVWWNTFQLIYMVPLFSQF